MAINEELQLGRAKNAVLTFLEGRLSVPKIYIDAEWAGHHIDVLAINRDGIGDVYAVLLFASKVSSPPEILATDLMETIDPLIDRFQTIPAQYKYICAVDVSEEGRHPLPGLPHPLVDKSFSPDGIGRVGFLAVQFPATEGPEVNICFKPERFRAKIAALADAYVAQHEADWEIRA